MSDDLISRTAALDIINAELNGWLTDDERLHLEGVGTGIELLPSVQPTLYGYKLEHLAFIARVMEKEGVTAEYVAHTFDDISRIVNMIIEEAREITLAEVVKKVD